MLKSNIDWVLDIAFWLTMSFLMAATLTIWLVDIDTAPKAPPCPIGLAEHFMLEKSTAIAPIEQIITPSDAP